MVDDAATVRAVARFARAALDTREITDLLYELAQNLTDLLEVTGVGVSLEVDGQVRFVTSPSEAIIGIERIQEERQAGPCVQAVRTATPVVIGDLAAQADTWPDYAEVAAAAGIRSVVGMPMCANDTTIGAVNIYHDEPREWSSEELAAIAVLIDIASGHVLSASNLQKTERLAQQLQQALDSRIVIEQAKGAIAATRNISVDEALELMRDHARSRGATLRSVAEAVVNLGLLPEG